MNTFMRPALMLMVFFTALTGIAYPLLLTAAARAIFPNQAAGSLLNRDGILLGSRLIGQNFTKPEYFWGRLSATAGSPYNPMASGGSNYGTMHPALSAATAARIAALREADPADSLSKQPLPADLATASGSGLDPEISAAAARAQIGRIARARGLAPGRVDSLVGARLEKKFPGFSGVERVNVLELNLALDGIR